jgi:phenylacetate-coenzyme A ligase PaaK-like adenylate-forming protein
MTIDQVLDLEQFSILRKTKQDVLLEQLNKLHKHHMESSKEYSRIVKKIFGIRESYSSIDDLPFIPVSAFKNYKLKSIKDENIFKVLTSSGTTGQSVSKVYLDKETAKLQTKSLSKIISHVIGTSRLPMLIIDSKSVLSNRESFSARGAGILGLSVFGKDHTYVLNENFELDESKLINFLEKYSDEPILIFGFTFMIWQYFINSNVSKKYDLSKGTLFHSGGWKKLIDIAVDNETFKERLNEAFGLEKVVNFYGMVEQVGSVFIENSQGNLHCPNFSDIIVRDPLDFSVKKPGEEGIIQVISCLPESYPGHSLLTEDIGVVIGEDDADNGWKGKHFKILGRAKKAELRGCSDTFNA